MRNDLRCNLQEHKTSFFIAVNCSFSGWSAFITMRRRKEMKFLNELYLIAGHRGGERRKKGIVDGFSS